MTVASSSKALPLPQEDSAGRGDVVVAAAGSLARAGKRSRDDLGADSQLTDALFGHLSKKCTTRELAGLRSVCTLWNKLVAENMLVTARARWEDSTTDWYFPVRSQVEKRLAPAGQKPRFCFPRTWAGVHHPSGEVHTLPMLMQLPEEGINFHNWSFDPLLASSGGLLLLIHNQRRLTVSTSATSATGTTMRACVSKWRPLIVSNPLTKRRKVLPECICEDSGAGSQPALWDYFGLRAHLQVDERANSYRVILMFLTCVCVYSSTANAWRVSRFSEPVPWGKWIQGTHRFCAMPSAFVDNTLYIAEVEVEGDTKPQTRSFNDVSFLTTGCVCVFEVDVDAGTWKPPIRYPLQNLIPKPVPMDGSVPRGPPALYPPYHYGFQIGSYGMALVECMGSLFAVLPARLDTARTMGPYLRRVNGVGNRPGSYESFGFLPLRFYVLRLQGTLGVSFGQVLVQLPQDRVDPEWRDQRRRSLLEFRDGDWLWFDPFGSTFSSRNLGFFRCTARGAVIWLTWSDYLVQFDVLTKKSSTQILPDLSFGSEPDLSYRPSFSMNP